MTIEALATLRYVEETALKVAHVAPTPAALALCTGVIPDYLDERLHADFREAARDRYTVLTRPGSLDGAPKA